MLNLVGLSPLKSMQCFQDSSVKHAHLCLPVKRNISSGRGRNGQIFKYRRSLHFKVIQPLTPAYFFSGKFSFSFPKFGCVALHTLIFIYKSPDASGILH